jgi:hypothetical protein
MGSTSYSKTLSKMLKLEDDCALIYPGVHNDTYAYENCHRDITIQEQQTL